MWNPLPLLSLCLLLPSLFSFCLSPSLCLSLSHTHYLRHTHTQIQLHKCNTVHFPSMPFSLTHSNNTHTFCCCRRKFTLIGHRGEISNSLFNYDSSLIATASMDQTAKLWDSRTGQVVATLRGHEDEVLDVTFDYTGLKLATASADGMVKLSLCLSLSLSLSLSPYIYINIPHVLCIHNNTMLLLTVVMNMHVCRHCVCLQCECHGSELPHKTDRPQGRDFQGDFQPSRLETTHGQYRQDSQTMELNIRRMPSGLLLISHVRGHVTWIVNKHTVIIIIMHAGIGRAHR